MKKKKLLKFIIIFIIVLIIILNIKIQNNLVMVFGYSKLKVISGSMEPTIKVGDLILIKQYDNYEIGDIITFKEENGFITHRIIDKNNEGYVTKGDFNNKEDDNIVSSNNIIGKVVHIFPTIGHKLKKLDNPLILLFIFLIGTTIVILIPNKKNKL